ncbi:hypothetical protein BLL42_27570 (plasmid) [Pseudomonas frederiksbergensis]|uniref:Uncharacterized protein n=1 Tax=Pseudomonas frederiksbergensis TaxID=104087 RepID=A0A1J0EUI9_9PSED|nr:hypothetical protein [Pseudomonas frederiksbergensis]APC19496.1 hypothetical protein BLL42_27570 [Pseudomonas frederiksbergensis]
MFSKNVLAIAVLCGITSFASAAGSWTQTSTGKDDSDGFEAAITTEYVVKNSIKLIRGNYRTAFVKTTFTPPVPLGDGRSAASTVSDVMVNCNDLSWGTASQMIFDSDMVPLMTSVGDFDRTKQIWTLKDMKPLDPASTTYKTGQFICAVKM